MLMCWSSWPTFGSRWRQFRAVSGRSGRRRGLGRHRTERRTRDRKPRRLEIVVSGNGFLEKDLDAAALSRQEVLGAFEVAGLVADALLSRHVRLVPVVARLGRVRDRRRHRHRRGVQDGVRSLGLDGLDVVVVFDDVESTHFVSFFNKYLCIGVSIKYHVVSGLSLYGVCFFVSSTWVGHRKWNWRLYRVFLFLLPGNGFFSFCANRWRHGMDKIISGAGNRITNRTFRRNVVLFHPPVTNWGVFVRLQWSPFSYGGLTW